MKLNRGLSIKGLLIVFCLIIFVAGCASPGGKDHSWITPNTPVEPDWIRNGEPVEFEGELWYPADSIENLLNSEVYQVGEYRGIQIFVDYTDVKPYDRLYTKFSKNKFRFFERRHKK